MKFRSFKTIREDLEALEKVTNKETLLAALPILVEAQEKLKSMSHITKAVGNLAKQINEECSKYARDHESIFVGGHLLKDGKGVLHGTLQTDSETYYFAAGFGKPIREDGGLLTQEFLDGLPKGYTKGKVELDWSKLTDEELEKVGLVRSANDVWRSDPDAAADCGD